MQNRIKKLLTTMFGLLASVLSIDANATDVQVTEENSRSAVIRIDPKVAKELFNHGLVTLNEAEGKLEIDRKVLEQLKLDGTLKISKSKVGTECGL